MYIYYIYVCIYILGTHAYIQGRPFKFDLSGNAVTFDSVDRLTNVIPRWKRHLKTIYTMEQYTPKECAEIAQRYIQNKFSIVLTQRAFRKKNKLKSAPVKNTIKSLYGKFVNTGNLSNASHASRQRTSRSDENIEAVRASIEETPTTSSYRRSQELDIARSTLQSIIHSDFKMFLYKIQMTQKLNSADYPQMGHRND